MGNTSAQWIKKKRRIEDSIVCVFAVFTVLSRSDLSEIDGGKAK